MTHLVNALSNICYVFDIMKPSTILLSIFLHWSYFLTFSHFFMSLPMGPSTSSEGISRGHLNVTETGIGHVLTVVSSVAPFKAA